MNIHKFYTRKTIGFLIVLALVILFCLFNSFIYGEKQGDTVTTQPYRAELSGEYVCLPHINIPAIPEKTEDCMLGLKTDTGGYYGIDFFLMSQTHDPISVGERISANGVVQLAEHLDANIWQKYPIEGVFSVTDSLVISQEKTPGQSTLSLGQMGTVMDVTISPQKIVSDSRCPAPVQCIWAGTVEVKTTLSTHVAHGEHILRLGEPQVFGDYEVTLIAVAPVKKQESILDADYHLTYKVTQ